jgi:hypothetical protein
LIPLFFYFSLRSLFIPPLELANKPRTRISDDMSIPAMTTPSIRITHGFPPYTFVALLALHEYKKPISTT